jgi:hypothetical protein
LFKPDILNYCTQVVLAGERVWEPRIGLAAIKRDE